MLSTRWRKIIGDLISDKRRTLYAILAIFLGVFGISVVANSYSILMREMNKNYMKTTPASATLTTSPIDEKYLPEIIDLPYIKDAVIRERANGRIQVGNKEHKDIKLFVISDFNDLRLDTFKMDEGEPISDTNEILLERKALSVVGAKIGDTVSIKIPNGPETNLKLTGTVHAAGLAPAWMEGYAYGYISPETYRLLGGKELQTELKILIDGDVLNKKEIQKDAYQLKDFLEDKGVSVSHIEIPKPGQHPHFTQMATLLYLMEFFGILALLLSSVLVANLISSILNNQIRQIGIMKTLGATTGQIERLYLGMVILLSSCALLFGIPLGIFVGRAYSKLAAAILNFNIYDNSIPFYIYLIEIAVGLIIPILTALLPIIKGSKITVREALNDYGINAEKYQGKPAKESIGALRFLPRPLLLSIRNAFRKKGRLIFTMLVMAIGGTGFIIAMNIYASMYATVDRKMDSIAYDVQLTFDNAQSENKLKEITDKIPGIDEYELWDSVNAFRINDDGTTGNSFPISAPPANSKLMILPPLYEGRWLNKDDTNAIVINQRLLSLEKGIKVGDEITLKINGADTKWKIIGVSEELIGFPTAYVNAEYLMNLTGKVGYGKNAVFKFDDNSSLKDTDIIANIEKTMADNQMTISSLIPSEEFRTALINHLTIIATFLIIMSILVVIVGGLGLATTISINTLERTREIGIMRSIGASSKLLTTSIISEGTIIGILSWLVSIVFSLPLSKLVSYVFGMTFFEAPLVLALSITGYIVWLLIIIVFAAAASYYPSKKATQMPVRNALSYE